MRAALPEGRPAPPPRCLRPPPPPHLKRPPARQRALWRTYPARASAHCQRRCKAMRLTAAPQAGCAASTSGRKQAAATVAPCPLRPRQQPFLGEPLPAASSSRRPARRLAVLPSSVAAPETRGEQGGKGADIRRRQGGQGGCHLPPPAAAAAACTGPCWPHVVRVCRRAEMDTSTEAMPSRVQQARDPPHAVAFTVASAAAPRHAFASFCALPLQVPPERGAQLFHHCAH